jgi:hypothetical protein
MNLDHFRISIGEICRWAFADFDVIGKWSALVPPYNNNSGWLLDYPDVKTWHSNTIVIMYLQDFVTVKDGRCLELEAIENHFGEKSNRVVVVNWTMDLEKVYTGPLNLMYFPWHSFELLGNLNDNRSEWESTLDAERTIPWQCLNGTARSHREIIADYVNKHFDNGILSMGDDIPLPDWPFNTYFGCENETNWMRLLPVYSQCAVNIVTETFYYTPGIITEKTIMAFLALQVPVVIGHKGIVEQLERLGFDMFRDLVETDYDTYDNGTRWHQALELNRNVIEGKFDRSLYMDRLLRNRNYALEVWPTLLLEQFNSSAQDIQQNLRQSS